MADWGGDAWAIWGGIFAPRCRGCQAAPPLPCGFCLACLRQLARQARAIGGGLPYDSGAVRGLVAALRSSGPRWSAGLLLRLLRRRGMLAEWRAAGLELVLPAPQSPRASTSGLALLAQSVAAEIGAVSLSSALRKNQDRAQHGRRRRDRMDTHCFVELAVSPACIAGRRVLLLDDVRVTGTTLDLSAYVLHGAGAREVRPFALAVQPPSQGGQRSLRPKRQ